LPLSYLRGTICYYYNSCSLIL